MKLKLSVALFLVALLPCAAVFATITIDTVAVGDPGNPNLGFIGIGGVNYLYSIGKYEVTVGQYTAFLNAVAADDTYGLYNPKMATDLVIAGIDQSGSPGSYSYSVIGSPNHPVTYVSWGDAARFVNWLDNGQPIGPQDASTTENGAYTLNGATTDAALSLPSRNPGARWVTPTRSEWHKAAYYQPFSKGGDADGYWKYPMRTNSIPYSDQPPGNTPDNTRVGNFRSDDGIINGYNDGYAVTGSNTLDSSQNYLTDVGAYTLASSYYGTFDQGGNAGEWMESTLNNGFRANLQGAWHVGADYFDGGNLPNFNYLNPSAENRFNGFRVALVPEPSTAALIGLAAVALFNTRRRRAPYA